MIAESDRMTRAPNGLGRVTFLRGTKPLPLVDPTAAARLLNVKRHTLACYRNLGTGPAYYKFGRWIRYATVDLQRWTGAEAADPGWALPELHGADRAGDRLLVDTMAAARFLTVTRFCLANYRAEGCGPPFQRYGRRLYYCLNDLREWAGQQRLDAAAQPTTSTR